MGDLLTYRKVWMLLFCVGLFPALESSAAEAGGSLDVASMQSALIPKREIGADIFLAENPTYDGRDVVVAIFDTGVDPSAVGLSITSTGDRKILDVLDASGSGDVDTSTVGKVSETGTLAGLSGKQLEMPDDLVNPGGDYRLGLKPAKELFPSRALGRLEAQLEAEWNAEVGRNRTQRERAERTHLDKAKAKAPSDRTREQRELVAQDELLVELEDAYLTTGTGPTYDCVVWHDGEHWRALIDTNRNGDLRDEKSLRPFGVAGEFGIFDSYTNASFGIQVYEDGDLLSIVTVSGTHGTHVASIATAHFPDEVERNGIAPGAQVLSIKIGDIRTGGSSYGISERRALALAATYGVDIVNASWGGGSVYQDGKDSNAKIYRTLVERYDILAVLSAGNDGPALSTNGSAGGEASRVLGVGAYASQEMGKVLYQSIKDTPNAALQFSSRGPTKDGDIGVDLMAPGAAWAAYSSESLKGAEMINGTSMSSPSAAGVAALVLSAAKQNELRAEPALLRNALILGTSPIEGERVFTTGLGLINANGAWEKLQALQSVPEFTAFYDLKVTGGTYVDSGRGLYLRQSLSDLRTSVSATFTPAWPESVSSEERFRFETDLQLVAADDWVTVPEYTHLANGDQRITIVLDVPPLSEAGRDRGSVITSRVDAFVANRRELGPLFSVPITVVRPADEQLFEDHKRQVSVNLSPAETKRLFLKVPDRADRLHLRIKHVAADPIARRYFIQALTPAADSRQGQFKDESVRLLEEGEAFKMNVPVKGGGVAELAFNQYFYSFGDSTLEVELRWQGIGAPKSSLVMEPNQDWISVHLDPLQTGEIKVEAKIEHGVHAYRPKTTREYYDDERSLMPESPASPGPAQSAMLRLKYEIDLKSPVKASLSDLQGFDASDVLGGGRLTVVHESGEALYNGFPDIKKTISFPEGKSTVLREYSSQFPGTLEVAQTYGLVLATPLKSEKSLDLSVDLRAAFRGDNTSTLKLTEGRERIFYIKDGVIDDLVKVDPAPDFFSGSITFEDEADIEIIKRRFVYVPGQSPGKVTNQDPKPKPAKDLKTESEKLAETWYDLQLKFIRDNRTETDADTRERRRGALANLLETNPNDPAPLIEQAIDAAFAAGLASDIWGDSKDEKETEAEAESDAEASRPEALLTDDFVEVILSREEILGLLEEAEANAHPDQVAAFFGATPVALSGDLKRRDEIEAETKKFEVTRALLAQIARLRADLWRVEDSQDEAWNAFIEVARWEEKPSEQTTKLETAMLREAKLFGLALKSINAQLEKKPFEAKLLKKRIELYREMEWHRFADQQEAELALREYRKALLKKL